MDLVTVSDHDSIDAAEALRRHADFFLSEEVTCHLPSGNELHVGVYDLTERQHVEIQRGATTCRAWWPIWTNKQLFYSVNHAFSALTGRRSLEDFVWIDGAFPRRGSAEWPRAGAQQSSGAAFGGPFRESHAGRQ